MIFMAINFAIAESIHKLSVLRPHPNDQGHQAHQVGQCDQVADDDDRL